MGLYYDRQIHGKEISSIVFLQYVDESSLRPSERIGNEGILLLNLCAV